MKHNHRGQKFHILRNARGQTCQGTKFHGTNLSGQTSQGTKFPNGQNSQINKIPKKTFLKIIPLQKEGFFPWIKSAFYYLDNICACQPFYIAARLALAWSRHCPRNGERNPINDNLTKSSDPPAIFLWGQRSHKNWALDGQRPFRIIIINLD